MRLRQFCNDHLLSIDRQSRTLVFAYAGKSYLQPWPEGLTALAALDEAKRKVTTWSKQDQERRDLVREETADA